jgi:hypothetical protein
VEKRRQVAASEANEDNSTSSSAVTSTSPPVAQLIVQNLAYSKLHVVRRLFPQARARAPDDDVTMPQGDDEPLQEDAEILRKHSLKDVFAASFIRLKLSRTGTW